MKARGDGHERTADGKWRHALEDVTLARPQVSGPVTVIPLCRPGEGGVRVYWTLAEAAELGQARVEEVEDGGRVGRVRVVNRGDLPILLIDGEELLGAKQDRVVSLTTLVPAASELEVPVVCVEAGRWRAVGGRFGVGTSFLNPASRRRKLADVCRSLGAGGEAEADQEAVWAGVQQVLRDLGVASRTSALADAQAVHRDKVEGLVSGFAVLPGQVGAVFLLGSRVVGVELLGDADSWARVFPRILRGYALDALRQGGAAAGSGNRRRVAAAALRRLRAAEWAARDAVGAGRPLTLEAPGVNATAVLLGERLVHLVAFFSGPAAGPGGGSSSRGRRRAPAHGRRADRGRLSVLVLDDDPCRHAEFERQGRGHRIDHVWLVDAALARLRRRRYDLVCLDNDLATEEFLREGREVAAFIAATPAERRPRAVLIHSWNRACALEMERMLRGVYEPGVSLDRVRFGAFRLVGPGAACEGKADLRRWIAREWRTGSTGDVVREDIAATEEGCCR